MKSQRYKTRLEIIEELGLSKATFYRILKRKGVSLSPGLISPEEEQKLRTALGFAPVAQQNINLSLEGKGK